MMPQNRAEQALERARRRDRVDAALLSVLSEADLLVPASREFAGGDRADLQVLEVEGASYVAVFTSEDQVTRAGAAGGTLLALRGSAVAAALAPHLGLVVNPGGDVGVALTPAEVAVVAGRASLPPEPADLSATIEVGEPAEEPESLLGAVREACAALPEVTAAWCCVVRRDEGEPYLLVAVRVRPPAPGAASTVLDRVLPTLTPVVAATSAAPSELAVVGDDPDGWLEQWCAGHPPFYRAPA